MVSEEWSHPVFATREEFEERLLDVLAVEQEQDEAWWYLSFATQEEFLGGLYIQARGVIEATSRAADLGLNPGGEVRSWLVDVDPEVFDEHVPPEKRMRLLTAEEVDG